jgi:HlyD family secretion protein
MKKLVPITLALAGLFAYVYFFHIQPGREADPTVRGQGSIEVTTYDISARLAARLATVAVEEGDEVAAGAVIATLDCADIEARRALALSQVAQAEALVAQAEAALGQAAAARRQGAAATDPLRVMARHAEVDLARVRSLLAAGGMPGKAADDAEAAAETTREQLGAASAGVAVATRGVDVAQRGVDVARAAVETARASVTAIDVQLAECTIVAPAAGVVLRRDHEPGETVLPGAIVARVGQLKEAYTWIYVSNEEIGRVRLGQPVVLVADTYPGRRFAGRIVRVNEEAEFTPRSIQTKEDRTRLVFGVKVAVPNTDQALLPGMPVEASLVEQPSPAGG